MKLVKLEILSYSSIGTVPSVILSVLSPVDLLH